MNFLGTASLLIGSITVYIYISVYLALVGMHGVVVVNGNNRSALIGMHCILVPFLICSMFSSHVYLFITATTIWRRRSYSSWRGNDANASTRWKNWIHIVSYISCWSVFPFLPISLALFFSNLLLSYTVLSFFLVGGGLQ